MQVTKRSSSIFKENHVSIEEEDNPSDKVVIVEEELDSADIDAIENLLDLPRLMFIDEECGNLKVVVDGGERTRNNNRKKKSEVLQAYRCQLKCYRRVKVSTIFLAVTFFIYLFIFGGGGLGVANKLKGRRKIAFS